MPSAHDAFASDGEADLLRRVRANDERASAEFVRRFAPRMLATARRLLGSEAAADDCVQEAFLSAFRNIDKFEERAKLSTWLHRIVVNTALMRLRSSSHRKEQSIDDLLPRYDDDGFRMGPEPEWEMDVSEHAQQQQIRDLVLAQINELPDNYRTVLLLRDIEEMSTREAADALGISEGSIKVRLHRARCALKTLLAPHLQEHVG